MVCENLLFYQEDYCSDVLEYRRSIGLWGFMEYGRTNVYCKTLKSKKGQSEQMLWFADFWLFVVEVFFCCGIDITLL